MRKRFENHLTSVSHVQYIYTVRSFYCTNNFTNYYNFPSNCTFNFSNFSTTNFTNYCPNCTFDLPIALLVVSLTVNLNLKE